MIECALTHSVRIAFPVIMKFRIAVPRYGIDLFCQHSVIYTVVLFHHVCSYRNVASSGILPYGINLTGGKIRKIPCGKTLPFKIQSHNSSLTVIVRRFNLIEAFISGTPESSPPLAVQFLYVIIEFRSQILSESVLAVVAEALTAKLIGYMPHKKTGVRSDTLG